MNAFGYGSGMTDYSEGLKITPSAPKRTIAQAEARIAKLERDLREEIKNANAISSVRSALVAVVENNIPQHKLANKDHRNKIYHANYRI